MSLARTIVEFWLTRLAIAIALLVAMAWVCALVFSALSFKPDLLQTEATGAAVSLGVLLILGKVIERSRLAALGLAPRDMLFDTVSGFAVGFGMLGAVIAILSIAGWYRLESFEWSAATLGGGLALNLLAAVAEETLFRGILFRLLEEGLGSWIALAVSAAIFGLVHLGNPGATLLSACAIGLEAGILLGAAYMLTRSLWFVIGLHCAWNFSEGTVFGAAVSGADMPSLVRAKIEGPELWTGGPFGPEAGLAALIVGTGAGIAMLAAAVHARKSIGPSWWRQPRSSPRSI